MLREESGDVLSFMSTGEREASCEARAACRKLRARKEVGEAGTRVGACELRVGVWRAYVEKVVERGVGGGLQVACGRGEAGARQGQKTRQLAHKAQEMRLMRGRGSRMRVLRCGTATLLAAAWEARKKKRGG
eukprot:292798-Pleurochrysis_carterae.AAC.1